MQPAYQIWLDRLTQLPEPGQCVLVYAPDEWTDMRVATYKPDNEASHAFITKDSNGNTRYVKGVTHWLPIPERPR